MANSRGFESAPTARMKACWLWIFGLALLLAGCGAGAGSGNGGNNISVSIANKVTSIQAGTPAIAFTATVQNDQNNSGVTWSLTANGASCSPGCGALSAATSTSVTYTPPSSAPAAPGNQPTLTATSVAKTNKSDSDVFTITPAVIVTITNKFSSVNTSASPFVVNATVQNDSTNSGVSWTLTLNGTACSPTCGSLSGITTSSVTYSAPASVLASQPTLTATSVHNTSKSDSDSFTIQAASISVSIGNKIGTAYAGGDQIFFEANVQNDPLNKGVTWTLTANGSPCSPACGSLPSPNPGVQSVVYTSPASVPASPNNHPTLTAISVSDGTKSDLDSFTISALPPISVTITKVSSVLAGGGGVNFSANIQYDPSSTPSVNWTLTASGTACSPTCGTLSNLLPASVTYIPPPSVPAAPNNQPAITATSAFDVSKSDSNTFSVTSTVANNCGAAGGHESLLNGHYAILLQGYTGNAGAIPLALGASFAADGTGKITGGEEDVNDTISPQHLTFTSNGSLYTVGSDNRGCLQLTNSGGTTTVFRFALGGINSGLASKGRIIEFDYNSGSGAGSLNSGILRLQDTNAFALTALASQYAFGVDGWGENDNQFVHLVAAGAFSNNNGNPSNSVDDENFGGVVFPESTGLNGGSIQSMSATTGRAVAQFDVFDWALYVISPSECFLVSTDPLSINAITAGRAIAVPSSPGASTLSGNYIVHTSGNTNGKASVDLDLLTMIPGGGQTGTLSGTVYSDGGGNGAQTTNLSGVTYNVDPASGRVALGNPSDNLPILYLTTPTDGISAFLVGVGGDAQMGLAEFQPSQTYSTASVAGTFSFGTEDPGANTIYNEVGTASISNAGAATGTADSSSTSALAAGVAFNPTFTINSSGVGSLSTIPSVAITNGTKIFYIDETVGVIVDAEQ
jgi:hypothetical protein